MLDYAAEILKLDLKATPGPWSQDDMLAVVEIRGCDAERLVAVVPDHAGEDGCQTTADSDLIASYRTLAPLLASECMDLVQKLRQERERSADALAQIRPLEAKVERLSCLLIATLPDDCGDHDCEHHECSLRRELEARP